MSLNQWTGWIVGRGLGHDRHPQLDGIFFLATLAVVVDLQSVAVNSQPVSCLVALPPL